MHNVVKWPNMYERVNGEDIAGTINEKELQRTVWDQKRG